MILIDFMLLILVIVVWVLVQRIEKLEDWKRRCNSEAKPWNK